MATHITLIRTKPAPRARLPQPAGNLLGYLLGAVCLLMACVAWIFFVYAILDQRGAYVYAALRCSAIAFATALLALATK